MDITSESKKLYQEPSGLTTDRHMLAIDEIQDKDTVLEIGVGWGELARIVQDQKNVKLYGVDLAEETLKGLEKYFVDTQLADISKDPLKFQDDQFDTVVCLEIFEHLQNPYYALTEIQRVLKPGGKLILSVPNHLGGHVMIYPGLITAKFFKLFLRQNFFKVLTTKLWGPVWNKDNIGHWLAMRIKNKFIALWLLRAVQVGIRIIQRLTRLFGLKVTSLYWCYTFICINEKEKMGKPLWLKQLEQTTELKENIGWYHHYYHSKS